MNHTVSVYNATKILSWIITRLTGKV